MKLSRSGYLRQAFLGRAIPLLQVVNAIELPPAAGVRPPGWPRESCGSDFPGLRGDDETDTNR